MENGHEIIFNLQIKPHFWEGVSVYFSVTGDVF